MIGKIFLAEIKEIAKNTRNGTNVLEAMKHIMMITNKVTHSIYVIDLLKTLRKKRIGTNTIENPIKKLCRKGSGREVILDVVLKNRIKDAYKEMRRNKYENTKAWREKDDILIQEGVLEGFLVTWTKEKMRYKKMMKDKMKKKITWLEKKYKKKETPLPDEYEGYSFKDQELGEEFKTSAIVYDNIELSTEEEEALKLHPKFTTYEDIDKVKIGAEIEKSFTKIRWEHMRDRNNTESTRDREPWKNIEKKSIDFRKLASTDLPFNCRVYLPEALEEKKEVEMHMLKEKLTVLVEEYTKNNKTAKRNLTKEQKQGIKRLRERREEGEIVIYQTDKSAELTVDSSENYIRSMETHTENDEVISEKNNKDIEKLMNAHAVCWMRFMQAGEQTGDSYRIKVSMQSKNNDPSVLYSLRKTHKKSVSIEEIQPDGNRIVREQGPPVRPVCDISDGVSHKFSYILSNILDEACNGETVCSSTEEMLSAIEKCNARGIEEDDIVGSADVKALYPSIPVDDAIDIVADEFEKKEIKIEGIDYEELGLYLALNIEGEELERARLGEVCPKRAHNGRKPKITNSGIIVNKRERFEPWIKAKRKPNEEEEKKMFKEGLKVGMKVVMKNHTYEFAQTIRKQREGGPIGMDLTGTIAKIFMKWWDGELLMKLEEVGIVKKLYERYVDDINNCIKETAIGARYINGRLEYTEDAKMADEAIPSDKRTFEIIRQIGNSIHQNIKLETDVPSNYEDKKLPILDLKVWIERVSTDNGEELKIIHKHYIKPMASKFVVNKNAAMPIKTKRTILTQMCLRVLLNNSEYLKMEEKKETVEYFMKRMQASGYDERFRYEVLKSALNAYNNIKSNPIRTLYRGKEMNTPRQRMERSKKKKNWYREGGSESVMFIPATPKSELANRIREEVDLSELKIRVVEKPGTKIKRLLQKNDPNKQQVCRDEKCFVCTTTKDGNCRKTGITYTITCKGDCGGDIYYGETNSNAYTRGVQHIDDYERKRKQSVMWKHCIKKHNGEKQQFDMSIKDYVKGDPTRRQILESVRINQVAEVKRINDKNEWIVGKIPTVKIGNM